MFKASVQRAVRTENGKQWRLEMLIDGQLHRQDFDKVAFCHGYQTVAEMPTFEGSDKFQGILMHSQQYRSHEPFEGKNVVILGLSSSASTPHHTSKDASATSILSHRVELQHANFPTYHLLMTKQITCVVYMTSRKPQQ